jgi:hypothetical protein
LHDIALQSGWETFLLAAPFVGMVLVGVFRLDEIATNSSRGQRPPFNGLSLNGPGFNENDENGRILLSDLDGQPDGQLWTDSQPWPHSGPGFDTGGPAATTPVN